MRKIFLDFETRSAKDLRKTGLHIYADHLSTDILCMAWSEMDSKEVHLWSPIVSLGQPDDLLSAATAHGCTIVAHNAPFEFEIWNKVCVRKYGFPTLKIEQMECTMAMAYAMALPGSLDSAAAATGLKHKKDMAGNRVMLQISKPRKVLEHECKRCDGNGFDEGINGACELCDGTGNDYEWWNDQEKFKRVFDYCKQDIVVEKELYKRLLPLSPKEKELWLLDHKINARGLELDRKSAEIAIQIVESEKKRLDAEMNRLTGNAVAVCNAIGQLKDWIESQGVKCEGVAKNHVLKMLDMVDLPPTVKKVLETRQEAAKASTAKITTMLGSAGMDDRLRGLFQYHGSSTGRWAGRRIQPHNFPRPKLKQKDIDQVFELLEGCERAVARS